FAYLIDIPAFLFLSGLFSKRTVDGRRYDKMLPYLYLYLFMKLFRFVVYSLVKGEAASFNLFSEGGVPWFALVLFLCYLVTTWMSALKRSYVLIFAFCMGMIAGYDSSLGSFLAGMRFLRFFRFSSLDIAHRWRS
ncbi:MAG: hypothetical protein LUF30_11995, partial [Lachnospiraceae bacterium]|nr:hypothetical protein [Lachnospiraceae bacterium]